MKRITFLVLIVTILLLGLVVRNSKSNVYATQEEKVFWCHCEPNGNCETLHLAMSALIQAGHVNAQGAPLHAGDHSGECVSPSNTPTPSRTGTPVPPTASPSATLAPTVTLFPSSTPIATNTPTLLPSSTPTQEPECEENCVTPSVEPTRVPIPTQPENGDGSSPPSNEQSKYSPPICTVALPAKPSIRYETVDSTTFKVLWDADDTNTTGWTLSWGYSKDNLPYGSGADKLQKEAREFTIGQVLPNTTRWVELGRWNGSDCVVYSDRIDP